MSSGCPPVGQPYRRAPAEEKTASVIAGCGDGSARRCWAYQEHSSPRPTANAPKEDAPTMRAGMLRVQGWQLLRCEQQPNHKQRSDGLDMEKQQQGSRVPPVPAGRNGDEAQRHGNPGIGASGNELRWRTTAIVTVISRGREVQASPHRPKRECRQRAWLSHRWRKSVNGTR